ncbi:MAG: penicillin-binding protein 2, partial [bacterium]
MGRLWQLQILQGPTYLRFSEENRLRDLRVLAPRGTIFDRRGRPLVINRAAFTVAVLPTELRNPEGTVPILVQILAVPEAKIRERLRLDRTRPFEPVRLRRDVSKEIVAMLEENRLDLPGVIIEAEGVRQYPYGTLAAHALGYVGEISEAELVTPARVGYRTGDLIGKTGVERVYDRILRGRDGKVRVEVDVLGRQLRVLRREPGEAGKSVVLTIDLDIQRAAEAALGDRTGAVVALDVRNGEVLALASHPAFDPNAFAGGISEREWTRLARDPAHPLLNRAVDSAYEPGSAFKIVTGTAALMRGKATRTTRIYDPGYLRLGGWVYRGLKAHGNVDFLTGLAVSSNVYFWTLGLRTGPDALSETAHALGLGERTGIDLPSETSGSIPSPLWKQRRLGEPWYPGDTVNMATGQGWVNTTAVQMARLVAAIGNGGSVVRPHLLRSVLDAEGRPVERKPVEP